MATLKDYIAYAKNNFTPKLNDEASQTLISSYVGRFSFNRKWHIHVPPSRSRSRVLSGSYYLWKFVIINQRTW